MQLIRIKEIAKEYNVSRSTLYRWSSMGKFPRLFARIGKILFVDETELRRIAKESKSVSGKGEG